MLTIDEGLELGSDSDREGDVDIVRHSGLLQGDSVSFSVEGGILFQSLVVDVSTVGVGNVPRRRLRHWDGSVGFGVVGQHTADISDEGIVGRRS